MASTTRKWLVGCGIGCGGAIVLSIVAPLLFGLVMMRPLDKAIEIQDQLAAEMGGRDAFSPPAGVVAPERLEAFLAVRQAVMPMCPRFTKFAEDLARMDELGKQSDKPDKGEVFRALTRVSGSVVGMAADIGQLNQLRNEALLAQRMGLGEYTWLYVLAYHSWLGNPVPDSADEDDGDGDGDGPRVEKLRALVIGMMRRYAEAEAAAGRADQATLWRTEADRMEGAAAEIPFGAGGLPADWAAAFEARGEELRAAWCGPMAEFELGQVRKSGMSVHSE
ncbi:MAG: hypothetical protein IPO18_04230 [bacterium]|nr:hypothetical protein [bacterium]